MGSVAGVLQKQGNFGLAASYYMKLGEKIKAMKCLINEGNIN